MHVRNVDEWIVQRAVLGPAGDPIRNAKWEHAAKALWHVVSIARVAVRRLAGPGGQLCVSAVPVHRDILEIDVCGGALVVEQRARWKRVGDAHVAGQDVLVGARPLPEFVAAHPPAQIKHPSAPVRPAPTAVDGNAVLEQCRPATLHPVDEWHAIGVVPCSDSLVCGERRLVSYVQRIVLRAQEEVRDVVPMTPRVQTVAVDAPSKRLDVRERIGLRLARPRVAEKDHVVVWAVDQRQTNDAAIPHIPEPEHGRTIIISLLPPKEVAREHAVAEQPHVVDPCVLGCRRGLEDAVDPRVGRQVVGLVALHLVGVHVALGRRVLHPARAALSHIQRRAAVWNFRKVMHTRQEVECRLAELRWRQLAWGHSPHVRIVWIRPCAIVEHRIRKNGKRVHDSFAAWEHQVEGRICRLESAIDVDVDLLWAGDRRHRLTVDDLDSCVLGRAWRRHGDGAAVKLRDLNVHDCVVFHLEADPRARPVL